jgi:hypothetical protein
MSEADAEKMLAKLVSGTNRLSRPSAKAVRAAAPSPVND